MKKTLQREANIMKSMEIYDNSPYYKKKYVNNRINSLAELKRIYIYLIGNTKGYTAFENSIKEQQPEAKFYRGKSKSNNSIEWNLQSDKVWDELLSHEKMSRVIKAMRIETYEELCSRVLVY